MNIITIVKIKQIFIALFKLILYLKQVPLPGFARNNLLYPDTAHDAAIRRSYDILANSGYHKGGAAITLPCIPSATASWSRWPRTWAARWAN